MKIVWKKKAKEESGTKRSRTLPIPSDPDLPFGKGKQEVEGEDDKNPNGPETLAPDFRGRDLKRMAESFQSQGNQLAEDGRYHEALGKWEAVLVLMPEMTILHEQKAQVLLEIGDAWNALKAATRATELEPTWAEAWVTLGRAQLNFGEPDSSLDSFDRALAIKPDHEEARVDQETALHLVKRRKQLHLTSADVTETRYRVREKVEIS